MYGQCYELFLLIKKGTKVFGIIAYRSAMVSNTACINVINHDGTHDLLLSIVPVHKFSSVSFADALSHVMTFCHILCLVECSVADHMPSFTSD